MKVFRKMTAILLMVSLLAGTSMVTLAENRDPIDGNTPEDLTNRIETSTGLYMVPSVMTDFNVYHYDAVIPISPKGYIDVLSGTATSQYADAFTHIFITDNRDYGPLAAQSLDLVTTLLGVKRYSAISINLMKYEGLCYKQIDYTPYDIEFVLQMPKELRDKNLDYAIGRLNEDGSVSILTDLDTELKTVTFTTNYFKVYNLYCLLSGPKGCFDAFKPVVAAPAQ